MNLIERRRVMKSINGSQTGHMCELHDNDFLKKTALSNNYPYKMQNYRNRTVYAGFDLMINGGGTYMVTFDTNYSQAYFGILGCTQETLNRIPSQLSIADTYSDTGWVHCGQNIIIQIPDTYNGSPVVCIRINMKANQSGTNFGNDFVINSFTIDKVSS